MFDNSPGMAEISSKQECKPDYAEMALKLKKRIDADKQCLEGMKAGINSGSVNLSRDQDVLYYAIIGSLIISIPRNESYYNSLLEKIEE